jgi:hypothetical protein
VELCVYFNPIASLGGIFEPDGFSFDVSWEIVFLSFDNDDTLVDVGW